MAQDGAAVLTVTVIEDEELVREGIAGVLASNARIQVIGQASSIDEALQLLIDAPPDVAVVDLFLGDEAGTALIERAGADHRLEEVRFLLLSSFVADERVIAQAVSNGAHGFLPKSVTPEQLVDAVERVHAGDVVLQPEMALRIAQLAANQQPMHVALTERERDITTLIANGMRNSEIADHLGLREGTVKTYTNRIFAKLGVRDRVGLVIYAYENNLAQNASPPDRDPRT